MSELILINIDFLYHLRDAKKVWNEEQEEEEGRAFLDCTKHKERERERNARSLVYLGARLYSERVRDTIINYMTSFLP